MFTYVYWVFKIAVDTMPPDWTQSSARQTATQPDPKFNKPELYAPASVYHVRCPSSLRFSGHCIWSFESASWIDTITTMHMFENRPNPSQYKNPSSRHFPECNTFVNESASATHSRQTRSLHASSGPIPRAWHIFAIYGQKMYRLSHV